MTELFIEKAIKLHGDKYDYSKVEYNNAKSKVIIICKEHGEFLQCPTDHLSLNGCKKCGIETYSNKRKSNTYEFIKKAIEVHCDKYDYSKVEYIKSKEKVIIICIDHGEFLQTPTGHLSGKGCIKCATNINANKKNKTKNTFIEEAIKIHGDTYDYSKVEYINANSTVIIICKEHGEFELTPNKHLSRGDGCKLCGIEQSSIKQRSNKDDFIKKAILKHMDENNIIKYTYDKVIYINAKKKVIITCNDHGDYLQTPNNHLSGFGCITCRNNNSGNSQRLTKEEFIQKAQLIHVDKETGEPLYSYNKIIYKNNSTDILIYCKIHGYFTQRPANHLNGAICLKCSQKHFSKSQIQWLNLIQSLYKITIQHAENNGEYTIPATRYKADGYCKETNTIYEFHGDYWHGNPKRYNPEITNKTTHCTFGELYQKTLDKEILIKSMGYNLVTIWESDWIRLNKFIKQIQQKFRNKIN